nr:MAG TPA: hypothetical protein [Caudoviricetes sp.]
MTHYKDELFHYSTKPTAAQLLRKKKRISAEDDTQSDEKVSKKKLSRRQMLLQALQKNPTKIGTDADESEENEEDGSEQDLPAKSKRKKLASKSVKGKPRFPLKKASR